ncbi:MAG TPA: hypothetical protein VLJ44_07330 [Gaiellaceae bacterium]|nr:hypothetical protein [Gaiellaceae bacterium]
MHQKTRVALLLLTAAAAFGITVPSAGSETRAQVIRLVWIQTSDHPSGKKRSWTSQLLNATPQFGKPAGAKVGAEVGFSHGARYVGGVKLPGGVLEYSGKAKQLPRHGGIAIAVVDGSGTFAGVKGTYTLSAGDGTQSKLLVLRLQYD